MRHDMYKVIVERPRAGRGAASTDSGRAFRNSEERPAKIGIKHGYQVRKYLNENLSPLRRWLNAQAHRPWDKVYSELSANIDSRNTVQQHIFAHIEQFVEMHAQLIDGKVMVRRDWSKGVMEIHESRCDLFVHPRTGILLPNRLKALGRRAEKERWAQQRSGPKPERRVIDAKTQWHRINCDWFEVTLESLPEAQLRIVNDHDGNAVQKTQWPTRWDSLRGCWVSRQHNHAAPAKGALSTHALFGMTDVYARYRRLLGAEEIRRRGKA